MTAQALAELDEGQASRLPTGRAARSRTPANTPSAMLAQAISTGASLEVVGKLMDLLNATRADERKMAFVAALSEAKSEIPLISKNRHVGFKAKNGGAATDYWHEDLAGIAKIVDPILSRHGLSYRFRPRQANGMISVTCIIEHRDGHSEESTMEAGYDNSGNKNSIQAVGSAATYLQRYTLKMALGLAASRDDDGGKADQTEDEARTLSEKQVMDLNDLIEETAAGRKNHRQAFLDYMKVASLSEIPAQDYERAVDAINSTRVRS